MLYVLPHHSTNCAQRLNVGYNGGVIELSYHIVSCHVTWCDMIGGGRGWNWTTFNLIHPGFRSFPSLPTNRLLFNFWFHSISLIKGRLTKYPSVTQILKINGQKKTVNTRPKIFPDRRHNILMTLCNFFESILLTRIVRDNPTWASTL